MWLFKPTSNLSAIDPPFIEVSPINATGSTLAVGDVVKFDLTGGAAPRADITLLADTDNRRNPFNVVVLSTAGDAFRTQRSGIWGVVTESAPAGARVKVCVFGVCRAKVTTTATSRETATGDTPLLTDAGVLIPAHASTATPANNTGAPVAIALEAVTGNNTARLTTVFFNGFSISVGGG